MTEQGLRRLNRLPRQLFVVWSIPVPSLDVGETLHHVPMRRPISRSPQRAANYHLETMSPLWYSRG